MTTLRNDSSLHDAMTSDHRRLERLLDALLAAFEADADEAATLWTQLEAALVRHFQLEERELFPELARTHRAETEALAREHAEISRKLLVLGIGVDLQRTRSDMVGELVSTLRAHATREDALLYRWANDHLSEQKRVTLRARLVATAASVTAR
jgi:hemerythrin-like domain-containing protein